MRLHHFQHHSFPDPSSTPTLVATLLRKLPFQHHSFSRSIPTVRRAAATSGGDDSSNTIPSPPTRPRSPSDETAATDFQHHSFSRSVPTSRGGRDQVICSIFQHHSFSRSIRARKAHESLPTPFLLQTHPDQETTAHAASHPYFQHHSFSRSIPTNYEVQDQRALPASNTIPSPDPSRLDRRRPSLARILPSNTIPSPDPSRRLTRARSDGVSQPSNTIPSPDPSRLVS